MLHYVENMPAQPFVRAKELTKCASSTSKFSSLGKLLILKQRFIQFLNQDCYQTWKFESTKICDHDNLQLRDEDPMIDERNGKNGADGEITHPDRNLMVGYLTGYCSADVRK